MPRPTRPQVVYGSAAVVLSTAAMLLLSQARSGVGVSAYWPRWRPAYR
jgi:hypothetical protein